MTHFPLRKKGIDSLLQSRPGPLITRQKENDPLKAARTPPGMEINQARNRFMPIFFSCEKEEEWEMLFVVFFWSCIVMTTGARGNRYYPLL